MNIYEIYVSFITKPDKRDELYSEMVNKLYNLITGYTFKVPKICRDDLRQELIILVHLVMIENKYRLDLKICIL